MTQLATSADLRGPTGLDRGAREALLRLVIETGIEHTAMVIALFRRDAYGGIDDYLEAVEKAHGYAAAELIRQEMRAMTDRHTDPLRLDWQQAQREANHIYGPVGFLTSIPNADFLTAIEAGLGLVRDVVRIAALPGEINKACERRGIPYRLQGVGRLAEFEWVGDAIIAEQVVMPALSALDDPRLNGGPKTEFNGAREQLRKNTAESRKRAVGEACSSVESTMKVLLDEHDRPRPKPENLTNLVDALISEGLVAKEAKEILVAPGFFGNRKGRHGAGPVAHDVSEAEAEATVGGAGVAIKYLASQLPG